MIPGLPKVHLHNKVLAYETGEEFMQAFSDVASGTEAENASLELIVIPARAVCRAYQTEVVGQDALVICPQCEGVDLEFTAGDELILESLEYEAPTASRGPKE